MNLSCVLAVAVLAGLLIWTGCGLRRPRSALCQEREENRCLRELVRAGAQEAGAELEQMCRLPAVPNFIAYKLRVEHSFGVSPPCCFQNLCRPYFQNCHHFFFLGAAWAAGAGAACAWSAWELRCAMDTRIIIAATGSL